MRKPSKHDPGKVAEYVLAAKLLEFGYTPCWPSSAQAPYDLVLASRHGALRIQVKGAGSDRDVVSVSCKKEPRAVYTKDDTDIVAVYLLHTDLWYLIPVEAHIPTTLRIRPGSPSCRWLRYQEAWSAFEHILGKT
jgi:hypothetical protein